MLLKRRIKGRRETTSDKKRKGKKKNEMKYNETVGATRTK